MEIHPGIRNQYKVPPLDCCDYLRYADTTVYSAKKEKQGL